MALENLVNQTSYHEIKLTGELETVTKRSNTTSELYRLRRKLPFLTDNYN